MCCGRHWFRFWRAGDGLEFQLFMQIPEISERLAALGNRCETMAVLIGMVSGQLERERCELQQLRAAIVAGPSPVESDNGAPSEVSPDMLAAPAA